MVPGQLTGESAPLSISQIGPGFGGFLGIILALRHEPSADWSISEIYGVLFVLAHSFFVAAAGMLPVLLFVSWGDEGKVWLVCQSIVLGFFIAMVAIQTRRVKRLCGSWLNCNGPRLFKYYVIPTTAITVLIAFSLVVGYGGFGVFVSALGYALFAAGVQFCLVLRHFVREADQRASR